MKYQGMNPRGFEADARYLLAWRDSRHRDNYASDDEMLSAIDEVARLLAADYDIPDTDIWDYLAEFDEEVLR